MGDSNTLRYLKVIALPILVAILSTMVITMLTALAVQEYFSGGPGREIGELAWTSGIPSHVFAVVLTAMALWAGYRAAEFFGIALAVVAGMLVLTATAVFFVLGTLLTDGVAEAGEFFHGPYTAQARLVLLAIAGGAVGTWLRRYRHRVT